MTNPKSYWSILKTFLNNKNNYNKEKVEIFNNIFAKQCSLINTNSDLPSVLSKETRKLLSTIHFISDEILKIIKNLNSNNAHGHDRISIWMIKICDTSIFKPLELISRSCLKNGEFPTEWKKANVVPAHKKGDKQKLKNYRPISLFPVAGKTFERILYILLYIYEFFIENNPLSPN